MVNYALGKIYKIVSNQSDLPYIGSTCKPRLSHRMATHRSHYKMYLNDEGQYLSSFEVLQYNDAKIILIEDFPCENKEQLRQRERSYIENTECVNKNIPGQTLKEWTLKNKDRMYEVRQQYYKKNRNAICAKQKEFYEKHKSFINCDYCDREITSKYVKIHEHKKKHLHNVKISTAIINNLL